MKASVRAITLGLLLSLPLSTAHAQKGPSISPIGNVTVNAGSSVNVDVIAVDRPDQLISVSAALPPFATLRTPTVGTGVVVTHLTIAPTVGQIGDYSAAVMATAGGITNVRVFMITVNAAGSDRAPIVTVTPWHEVTAGSALSFTVNADDADDDAISSLSALGMPMALGASFTPNGSNMAGTFSWTPDATEVGEYDVMFTASNALSGSDVAHIRVVASPALAIVPISDVTVEGGSFVSVPVQATGVPGALIQLTAALPSFAVLDPPGSGTGSVSTSVTVSPPTGSAGTYHASITATSEGTSVTELFDIIVTGDGGENNQPPVLSAPMSATVEVGTPLAFNVTAMDPDGEDVQLEGSALPPGSSFIDHGNETGTFSWTPVAGQAGTYQASFTGRDERGATGSATTVITVTGGISENHPPVVSAPPTAQVNEGSPLSFTVSASDEDGDPVTLSTSGALPSGMTFVDHGNNTGTVSWMPSSDQSGSYTVGFVGNDGEGGIGTASTTITVNDVAGENHPPTVSAPKSVEVTEGQAMSFTVTGADQDGDPVDLFANGLPPGAAFTDLGNSTGTFSWTPSLVQAGTYQVEFVGTDGQGGTGTANTSITVLDQVIVSDVDARACLVGKFKPHRETTCFRIKPIGNAFELEDVVLSSIVLRYKGKTMQALEGARIDLHCHRHVGASGEVVYDGAFGAVPNGVDTGGDDDDDDDGGGDRGRPKCNLSCDDHHDHGHHGDKCGKRHNTGCDTLGVKVCFSTAALIQMFANSGVSAMHGSSWRKNPLPCALVDAEIVATLTNGATVVARFPGSDDRRGHTSGDGSDVVLNDRISSTPEAAFGARVVPNPLKPNTELSFTMPRDGTVHVAVYDMQGRLVKTLLNEHRAAGPQTLPWNGTNQANVRVANGVYFLRIHSLEGAVTRRITVVK